VEHRPQEEQEKKRLTKKNKRDSSVLPGHSGDHGTLVVSLPSWLQQQKSAHITTAENMVVDWLFLIKDTEWREVTGISCQCILILRGSLIWHLGRLLGGSRL
jgi:hypothetical protein